MLKTFQKVHYRVLRIQARRSYILGIADKEWSAVDFKKLGKELQNFKWKLEEVPVSKIKPNLKLLKTKHFQKDLSVRIPKIHALLTHKKPIPPLILRGKDRLIFDGYARYHVFKDLRAEKCLAYVGYLR